MFLGVPAIFTNLHFVHQYYPYASAIYLLAGMAYAVAPADGEPWHRHSIVVTSIMFALVFVASVRFLPQVIGQDRGISADLLNAVQNQTEPGDVVLVRGLDWSSDLGYRADRKTIMDRSNDLQPPRAIRTSLQNVTDLGLRVGAFVSCGPTGPAKSTMERNYVRILKMMNVPSKRLGGCRLFIPDKR